MARATFLSFALPLLLLLSVSLADHLQHHRRFREQSQCRIDKLNALEPTSSIQHEGGKSDFWDVNDNQFDCAGVAASRHTIQPKGLLLPSYSNSPALLYVIQGEGIGGLVIPGCPETFQSLQQSRQSTEEGRGSRRFGEQETSQYGDRHQKIDSLRQGDLIAVPAGVSAWAYNHGDRPLIVVAILDTSNYANQLDNNPRRFFLAGSSSGSQQHEGESTRQREGESTRRHEGESTRQREGESTRRHEGESTRQREGESTRRHEGESTRQREGESTRRHEGESTRQREGESTRWQEGESTGLSSGNIFDGFDVEIMAEALGIDRETARKLKSRGQEERRGFIIRLERGLQVARPRRGQQEQGEEERSRKGEDNGVEETLCNARFRENIGNPSRADVYSREGGHVTTLNSQKLPILNYLQLSAERGHLRQNAILAPHWNMNSHSVIYVIRGNARVQINDNNGRAVFNGRLRQGQILVVPQNFVVVKKAENEEFEWVSFKTNDNALSSQLAGKSSVFQGIPDDVLANSYQISREEARRLKYGRSDEMVVFGPRSQGRASE